MVEDLEVIVGRTNTDRPTKVLNEATDERKMSSRFPPPWGRAGAKKLHEWDDRHRMPNLEKQTLSLRDGFNFKQFRELINPSKLCILLLQLPEFLEFESKWVSFAQGGVKDERSNTRMIEGVGLRDVFLW